MTNLDADYPVFEERCDEDGGVREVILDLRFPSDSPIVDRDGREYDFVGKYLENEDSYQGLNMITVIKRKSDDKLFGYSWWDDISKHGSSYVESNGDEFGLECDTDADGFDWDTDYISYYVWQPVEAYYITAYRNVTA